MRRYAHDGDSGPRFAAREPTDEGFVKNQFHVDGYK
jgi:hypothetical protein